MDRQELIDRLNGNYPDGTQPPRQRKVQREGQLQMACVRWFRLQYPAFSTLLFHPKNEADGATSGKKIAINAASGVVSGVPDLILALPSLRTDGSLFPCYLGLGIELKYGKTNNQTAHQRLFQGYWESAGYKYALCRSLEEFMQVANDYVAAMEFHTYDRVCSFHRSHDDTEHNRRVLDKITKDKNKDDHGDNDRRGPGH